MTSIDSNGLFVCSDLPTRHYLFLSFSSHQSSAITSIIQRLMTSTQYIHLDHSLLCTHPLPSYTSSHTFPLRMFRSSSMISKMSFHISCPFVTSITCRNPKLETIKVPDTVLYLPSFTDMSTHYYTLHDLNRTSQSYVLLVSTDNFP